MPHPKLKFLVALQSIHGLGPIRLKTLLDHFTDPELVWNLPKQDIDSVGLPKPVVQNFLKARHALNPDQYLDSILTTGISVISIFDADYPKLLRQIYDPPLVLFYQGDLKFATDRSVAIVGSRKMTGYGKLVTTKLSEELSMAGLCVVSGLARGVDTVAHQTAVICNFPTIAVLAGGLDQIFPPENSKLASQIIQNGLLVSEFPPGSPHLPANFPSRNRIISGLSRGVVVTEADIGSGSLITAQIALDENRPVFAVPGPITSQMSSGCHLLIKNGAILTTSSQDILENLGFDVKPTAPLDTSKLSKSEIQLLTLLDSATSIDDLARTLKLPSAAISATLLKLEIGGFVTNLGSGNFIKN